LVAENRQCGSGSDVMQQSVPESTLVPYIVLSGRMQQVTSVPIIFSFKGQRSLGQGQD